MLYFDVDGVLLDFNTAAIQAHGRDPDEIQRLRVPGVWDITPALEVTHDEFWKPIHRLGEDFWIRLPHFSWYWDLIELAKRRSMDDWGLITSPSLGGLACRIGKLRWAQAYLPEKLDDFHITPYKTRFAKPGAILIDDQEENVAKFVAAGGHGIVFPSIGNRLYAYADNPLPYVTYMLEQFDASVLRRS